MAIDDVLTTEQARRIRDNHRVLTNRPPGVDLPAVLETFKDNVQAEIDAAEVAYAAADAVIAAELAKVVSGTATILDTTTSIAVTLGAAFDGKLAVVSFAEAPTAATLIFAVPVASGDLTISIDQDNTADLDVHYIVDGR